MNDYPTDIAYRLLLGFRIFVAGCVFGVGVATFASSQTPRPLPAGVGLTDPTLAYGLMAISDWSTEMPFLDLAKSMRPWFGMNGYNWGTTITQDSGALDASGWITHIPDGSTSVGTIWAWGDASQAGTALAESRAGTYVLTYEGTGSIKMTLGAQVISSEPGRIVFSNPTGTQMGFEITSTDPNGTGNYIHDIHVVNEKYEALFQAGELFNPDWLSVVNDARELRFMDWMQTNGSITTDWAQRPEVADATWQGKGVPLEVMVQLANQTGTDPWFNIPARASDDYIRQFATYVRDHLDPGLTAHVEYSNENWNGQFNAYHWLQQQSQAVWGVDAPFDYWVMRAVNTAQIWDQVFGNQADTRVSNVLATQTANPWVAGYLMQAPKWEAADPMHYVAPASVFDELAVATYFGGMDIATADNRAALLAAINNPNVDVMTYLHDELLDPNVKFSLPDVEKLLLRNKQVADQYGLKMTAYEGGAHILYGYAAPELSQDDIWKINNALIAFASSTEMGDLYQKLWDMWSQISDGPFMQYGDVSAHSKWGVWGLFTDLASTNARADVVTALAQSSASWFGNGGGTQYQQGVIHIAGDTGEVLTGTAKQDFLVGGAGNDTFVAGAGNDGINGGAGTDIVELPGAAGQYRLVSEGKGYRLTGPGVSDYVVNVEGFAFEGGSKKTLAEMLKG